MNDPSSSTEPSFSSADFSLNCVIRLRSPSDVIVAKSQQSSLCSGTVDWIYTVVRSGSMPAASRLTNISRAAFRRSPAS